MNVIVANIISIGSSVAFNLAALQKNFKNIIKMQILGNILVIISSLLLGAYSGVFVVSVVLIRNIIRHFDLNKKWMIPIFCLFQIFLTIYFNVEGILFILPLLAEVPYTIVQSKTDSKSIMLYMLMLNSLFWGTYNFFTLNYIATISCTINIILCIYTLLKDRKQKELQNIKKEEVLKTC